MMDTNSSISLIMSNVLIGLCKGSKYLTPYSTVFHKELGYVLFSLELSFRLSNNRDICPDAIVISSTVENTLLFEWTELNDPTLKNDQLNRYARVKTSDLINIAAVPPKAAHTCDIALTVRPRAVENFRLLLDHNGQSFPILALDQQEHCTLLIKVANTFQTEPVDQFFSTGVEFSRVPRYIPFSLETHEPKDLVQFVVQNIISLLAKGETSITLPDFCRSLVPAWDFIGKEKQRDLSELAKGLIKVITRRKWNNQIVRRVVDDPPTWELSPDKFKKNQKSLNRYMNELIAEVRGDTYQYDLDLDARTV